MRDIYVAKGSRIRVPASIAKRFLETLEQEDEREIRVFGTIEIVPDEHWTDEVADDK